ncbi:lamin tail domain-containing protein [Streptomyces sp. NPDC087903]|uniref:lamin tail domain-containing protein n=1 Tax=Streptomyces sp. NPDC087903 TaxID=3365819 RepID=UPI0037FEF00D
MSVSASVTARRLAAAALAAGAVVAVVTLPASAADHSRPGRSQVEISAVQYDSPGPEDRSNRSLNKEWVELTNTKRHSVNLDGWTLRGEDGRKFTFRHYRLEGHATVRIHTGEGRDSRTDLYQDRRNYAWDNRSDTATLRNDHGRFVDDESWGRGRHHGGDDRHHGGDSRHHDGDNRHHGGDNRHHDGDNRHHADARR